MKNILMYYVEIFSDTILYVRCDVYDRQIGGKQKGWVGALTMLGALAMEFTVLIQHSFIIHQYVIHLSSIIHKSSIIIHSFTIHP
jgi:hypothetical protein